VQKKAEKTGIENPVFPNRKTIREHGVFSLELVRLTERGST